MKVWAAGKDIGSSQEAAQDMDYPQIQVSEIEQPSSLAMVKVLGLMSYPQNRIKCNSRSPLSRPPTPENFHPGSS